MYTGSLSLTWTWVPSSITIHTHRRQHTIAFYLFVEVTMTPHVAGTVGTINQKPNVTYNVKYVQSKVNYALCRSFFLNLLFKIFLTQSS